MKVKTNLKAGQNINAGIGVVGVGNVSQGGEVEIEFANVEF